MLKERINKLFSKEKSEKNKIENLVFFLIILVITIVAINIIWKDDKEKSRISEDKKLAVNEKMPENTLESKLEEILSNINGVGNVKVLLTYNETEELIPVYNKKNKTSLMNENDSSGGTRSIEESDLSEEVVYQNEKIITQKTVSPKIEGAIITATGANNSLVKTNIIQAVEAVTGLATHKIQVFEKQG